MIMKKLMILMLLLAGFVNPIAKAQLTEDVVEQIAQVGDQLALVVESTIKKDQVRDFASEIFETYKDNLSEYLKQDENTGVEFRTALFKEIAKSLGLFLFKRGVSYKAWFNVQKITLEGQDPISECFRDMINFEDGLDQKVAANTTFVNKQLNDVVNKYMTNTSSGSQQSGFGSFSFDNTMFTQSQQKTHTSGSFQHGQTGLTEEDVERIANEKALELAKKLVQNPDNIKGLAKQVQPHITVKNKQNKGGCSFCKVAGYTTLGSVFGLAGLYVVAGICEAAGYPLI